MSPPWSAERSAERSECRLSTLSALRCTQISPQRHEREVERVQVILQVKDLREPGAGKWLLVPGAVGALGADQPVHAGADTAALLFTGGQQSQQSPGRL